MKIRRITALIMSLVMVFGLTIGIKVQAAIPVDGNIFNGGNALMADSWGQWGQWGNVNNGVITNPALRWAGGRMTPCYASLALEPNTTYTVRMYARASVAGSPETREDSNKACFQYRSASEEAAGADQWDKFNLYITDNVWKWYEGEFTTPSDMTGSIGNFGSITIVNGFSDIEVEQMFVVNELGVNIFNGGKNMMVDSLGKWSQWGAYEGTVTNPTIAYAGSVHTATYTQLALQPLRTYDVKVLARSAVAGSPTGNQNSNKVCFQFHSPSFEVANPDMGTWDKFNIYITSDQWEWYEGTFTTAADMYGTFGQYGSITIQNNFSDLYIEQLMVIENIPEEDELAPSTKNRLPNGDFSQGFTGWTFWSDDGEPKSSVLENYDPVWGNVAFFPQGGYKQFIRFFQGSAATAIFEFGKPYLVRVVYKADGIAGAKIGMAYDWSSETEPTIYYSNSDEWVAESFIFVRDPDRSTIGFYMNKQGGGNLYIAEISVEEFTGSGNTVVVSFDFNGGTGPTSAITGLQGYNMVLPSATRYGYNFLGWYTKADNTGSFIGRAGDTFVPVFNVTLYAQWAKQITKWPLGTKLGVGFNPYAEVNFDTYNSYKANFHTHTTNSDGAHTAAQMLEAYYAMDYNIVAITDHNVIAPAYDKTNTGALTTARKDEMAAGLGRADGKGMIGIDYTNEQSQVDHVNTFWANYNQSYSNDTILERLYTAIRETENLGGLSHINHPGRETGAPYGITYDYDWSTQNISRQPEVIQKYVDIFNTFPESCVGMEIINKTDGETAADRILWDNILMQTMSYDVPRPVFGFSNDDAHSIPAAGYSFNMVFMPELTQSAIRNAMETGAFYAVSRVARLEGVNGRLTNGGLTPAAGDLSTAYMLGQSTPTVSRIAINGDTITITGKDYDVIEWIADDAIIATGESINLNDYAGAIGHYIRAQLRSTTGIAFLQAFGVVATYTPPEAVNLLPNGDFADGMQYWNRLSGTCSISNKFAEDVGNTLFAPKESGGTVQITNTQGNAQGVLKAGEEYMLQVLYYNAGTSAANDPTDRTYVGITALNNADVELCRIHMSDMGKWTTSSVKFIMPENFDWMVFVRFQTAAPDIYIASISLFSLADPDPGDDFLITPGLTASYVDGVATVKGEGVGLNASVNYLLRIVAVPKNGGNKYTVTLENIKGIDASGNFENSFTVGKLNLEANDYRVYIDDWDGNNVARALVVDGTYVPITEIINVQIETPPSKLVYQIGESLDLTGMTLRVFTQTGTVLDEYIVSVTSGMVSGFDSSSAGIKQLTVLYDKFERGFSVTVEVAQPAYSIALGAETAGGAGYQRSITVTGGSLEGKFLVARAASGTGESTKLVVMLITASAEAEVSYSWANAQVDVWLTDGLPNLTSGSLGAIVFATAGSGN